MALVNVKRMWSKQMAELSQEQGIAAESTAYSEGYTVLFDAPATAHAARSATGIPSRGDAHPDNSAAKVIRKRAYPIGPHFFQVDVDYVGKDSPLLDPYEKAWRFNTSTEPVDADKDGAAFLNPLGDRYVGITKEFSDPVYVVTRNEASYDIATKAPYQNAVNSDTFLGMAAGTARMLSITGNRVVDGTDYYWRVTYEIQFRNDGWGKRVLCEGKRYWTGKTIGGAKQIVAAVDSNGQPVNTPVRLSATGTLLDPADDDVFQTFYPFDTIAFSGLSLS